MPISNDCGIHIETINGKQLVSMSVYSLWSPNAPLHSQTHEYNAGVHERAAQFRPECCGPATHCILETGLPHRHQIPHGHLRMHEVGILIDPWHQIRYPRSTKYIESRCGLGEILQNNSIRGTRNVSYDTSEHSTTTKMFKHPSLWSRTIQCTVEL